MQIVLFTGLVNVAPRGFILVALLFENYIYDEYVASELVNFYLFYLDIYY